mmetsp:Transcript_10520/g.16141  ORF Transcript_10520/g.16141 Transcript_10520/m.16141 type:complete len:231 (-) Transcript_10520:785-1477(-)
MFLFRMMHQPFLPTTKSMERKHLIKSSLNNLSLNIRKMPLRRLFKKQCKNVLLLPRQLNRLVNERQKRKQRLQLKRKHKWSKRWPVLLQKRRQLVFLKKLKRKQQKRQGLPKKPAWQQRRRRKKKTSLRKMNGMPRWIWLNNSRKIRLLESILELSTLQTVQQHQVQCLLLQRKMMMWIWRNLEGLHVKLLKLSKHNTKWKKNKCKTKRKHGMKTCIQVPHHQERTTVVL